MLRGLTVQRGPSDSPPQGATDGPRSPYPTPHPNGRRRDRAFLPHRRRLPASQPEGIALYESLKKLSDSEILTLALLQQLRGVQSERSFLRDCERFFSHLFPGIVGFHPSSFHRRVRKLRRFLEPMRRVLLEELAGDPETLIVDSTLLPVLHPRRR